MNKLGTWRTCMSVPSGASFTLPMPPTMRTVPSSVCTFLSKEHSSYDTNIFDIGVIWSVAPESKIQVF